MPNILPGQAYCKTCNRVMDIDKFYLSNNLNKYPEGVLDECKKCFTRHVDNWEPKTFIPLLKEIDIPYIKDEWDNLLLKFGQDPTKVSGTSIFGRYLSKMKLKQYRDYCFADSDKLNEQNEANKRGAMIAANYSEDAIDEALKKPVPKPEGIIKAAPEPIQTIAPDEDVFSEDLTEEDKQYLTIKWGRIYKPYEWVQLEKYYQDMMNSFDIQTPSHEDYLKLICKSSLKAHQLIDMGDIEGFQKVTRVLDTLMKSANFTAAQNKTNNGEFINSIGELALLCEKEEGFIPRYYISQPNDKVDEILQDNRNYVHNLVTKEMNLGALIENAVKALQKQAEQEKQHNEDTDDEDATNIDDVESLVNEALHEDDAREMTDEDYLEFEKMINEEAEADVNNGIK